ncbi:unnamed protein product [Chondrus crispus]|uniref:Uncharacterized protein n=1 Tax=Chondrus crispus TaxID=2769 RepID=R7QAA4_CHOCR|nr:unnamed protein product [Chondrus crispus]CDF34713.1 unnamed protein product [Chondrus crispus]|eukprot:XP_005714532.1 unnamed protein product [Chondrus crispus]
MSGLSLLAQPPHANLHYTCARTLVLVPLRTSLLPFVLPSSPSQTAARYIPSTGTTPSGTHIHFPPPRIIPTFAVHVAATPHTWFVNGYSMRLYWLCLTALEPTYPHRPSPTRYISRPIPPVTRPFLDRCPLQSSYLNQSAFHSSLALPPSPHFLAYLPPPPPLPPPASLAFPFKHLPGPKCLQPCNSRPRTTSITSPPPYRMPPFPAGNARPSKPRTPPTVLPRRPTPNPATQRPPSQLTLPSAAERPAQTASFPTALLWTWTCAALPLLSTPARRMAPRNQHLTACPRLEPPRSTSSDNANPLGTAPSLHPRSWISQPPRMYPPTLVIMVAATSLAVRFWPSVARHRSRRKDTATPTASCIRRTPWAPPCAATSSDTSRRTLKRS